MSYVNFNHAKLTNLEFTTKREIVRSNHAGSFISTTLNGCNTRKYHGLLVCPIGSLGGGKHVLLSALDESIRVKGATFNLSTRRYAGGYIEPKGYKYFQKFDFEKIPRFTFQAGDVVLTKERLLVEKEQQLLVKYSVEETALPITLRFRPFLAFRNIHDLSKSNMYAQTHCEPEPNGISLRLYDGYPRLFMQFSQPPEYHPAPDWHYDVEYIREKERGYACLEDLFSPGFFEVKLKKSESVVFSASTFPVNPVSFKQRFSREVSKRISRDSFTGCLKNAANQFIQYKDDIAVDIIAGFPWYNSISRETFIALPGLRIAQSERRLALEVLSTYLHYLKNGFFPDSIADNTPLYHSPDASLWFIWTMQHFKKHGSRFKEFGPPFYQAIKEILTNIRKSNPITGMLENGLLFAVEQGVPLTWMDSASYGQPNVPRYGKPVELNALWFNAVCFALEMARNERDADFLEEWKHLPEKISDSFLKTFWNNEKGYLADVENGLYTDWSIRPNMVIAAAMPYTPLSLEQREKTLEVARHHLLTPRGLRSLTPDDPQYYGSVEGPPDQREEAIHKGTAFPWLIQFFADAWLTVHGKTGVPLLKKLISGFECEMSDHCIGSVSEMYNGSSPQAGKGAVSQAWNVGALLYTLQRISEVENE
jgi:predicted glycogen debranching enzyme